MAGVAGAANFSLTNSASPPASVAVNTGSPQTVAISTQFASALQVIVRDAGNNPVSGVTVNFGVPNSGASAVLSSNSAITNGSGLASVTATANTTAGSYSVTAAVSGVTGVAAFTLTNTAGPPASIVATAGTPQAALAGTLFATVLQAAVRDAGNNPVSGVVVSFTAPSSGASAALAGAAVTDALGLVSVTATANAMGGGPYNVVATAGGVASAANFQLTNIVFSGVVDSVTATGGVTQSTPVTSAFSIPLEVTVRDSSNAPLAGAPVTFTALTAPGARVVFLGDSITAIWPFDESFPDRDFIKIGTSGHTTGQMLARMNEVLAQQPAGLVVFGGTNDFARGIPLAAIQANLAEIARQAVANNIKPILASILPVHDYNANISPEYVNTNERPIASIRAMNEWIEAHCRQHGYRYLDFAAAMWDQAGFLKKELADDGLHPNAAGFQVMSPLALDAIGQTVQPPGGSAVFPAPLAFTNSAGVARVNATANGIAGSYQVTASSQGKTATFALTNQTGLPASVAVSGGSGQVAPIDIAFPVALQARVRDASGNPIPNVQVTFRPPVSGPGTLPLPSATTDIGGVAIVDATANGLAGGPYTVAAEVAGVSASADFLLINSAGLPTAVANGGGSQSAGTMAGFAAPLQVLVRNGGGAPLSGVVVYFSAPPVAGASATLSSSTATTNGSGVASVTAIANAVAGSYLVTATAPGLATGATFALTNLTGPPASIEATAGTPQFTIFGTPFAAALKVTVRDAQNNPAANVLVTWSPPASGASATLSSLTSTTNSLGVATVNATANGVQGSYIVTATIPGASAANFSLSNTAIDSNPGPPGDVAGPLRINVGGAEYQDSFGLTWLADQYFSGGVPYSSIGPIVYTTQTPLYGTQRVGNFTYHVPVRNGLWALQLKYAELTQTGAGQRVFDVFVNNQLVAKNYDVAARSGGSRVALNQGLTLDIRTGYIEIRFQSVVGSPILNGIELVPSAFY